MRCGIEPRRAASDTAPPQLVSDLVGGSRNDCVDAAPTEMSVDCTGGIRAIRENGLRPGPGAAESAAWNPGSYHDGVECVSIPAWPEVTWRANGRASMPAAR